MSNLLEFKTNFSRSESNNAVELKTGQDQSYYKIALEKYCQEHDIDYSSDERYSIILMSEYMLGHKTYWFCVDEE